MKKLELVSHSDPMLSRAISTYEYKGEESFDIAKQLAQAMYDRDGMGLAANQVGLDIRLFVMRWFQTEANREVNYITDRDGRVSLAVFNPIIVDTSEINVLLEEGCLSYPGLMIKVKRPKHIKVRFTDCLGQVHTVKFTGITARVVQHEIDHLNGLCHVDKANRYHRELAFKKRSQNATIHK